MREHPNEESDEGEASDHQFDVHHVPRRSVVTRKMHATE